MLLIKRVQWTNVMIGSSISIYEKQKIDLENFAPKIASTVFIGISCLEMVWFVCFSVIHSREQTRNIKHDQFSYKKDKSLLSIKVNKMTSCLIILISQYSYQDK